MNEFPDRVTCKKICDLLQVQPGLTLSLIAEKLSIHISLAEKCLNSLELNKQVFSVHEQGV